MERRFGFKDIVMRHLYYNYCKILHREIYDYKQQSFLEYGRCQEQRKIEAGTQDIQTLKQEMEKCGTSSFFVSRIAVSVTNQCSLKCCDCNNLMPYCKEKFTIDVGEQIDDLKKLLSYVDEIINVEVIGGEPFVYSQLPILLSYLCEESKIKFIEITSNGTILPAADILNLLKNPKVCVLLSDYGKVNEKNVEKTYQYLIQNGICVQNLRNREWIQGGGIARRGKSKRKMKYEYFHCFARKDCRTLYKGKLYVCGRAPILDELGLLTDNSSFLDIRQMNLERESGKREIHKFFKNDYAECCDFCDVSSDSSLWIESGIQK